MLKHTLTAAAMAVVLAAPAYAQQPTPDANKQIQATDQGMKKDMKSDSAPQGAMSKPDQKGMADKRGMTATDGTRQAGFVHQQEANEWRASELIGASVYGPNDKSIGDINELLVNKDGQVTAVVVGVGGFLGVGEKNVALGLQELNVQRKDGEVEKITVSYTKEQLNNAPAFAYYEGGQTETTGAATGAGGNVRAPIDRDKTDSKMMPEKSDKKADQK